MKQQNKLYKEYWEEREKEKLSRLFRAGSMFSLFNSDSVPLIKEMMLWAYKKGIAKSKTQGATPSFNKD